MAQVLQRKPFKDIALTSAGVQAFTEYVAWYHHNRQVYVLSPSALDVPSLRHTFLVLSKHDAISSMAHTMMVTASQTAQKNALTSGSLGTLAAMDAVVSSLASRATKNGATEEEVRSFRPLHAFTGSCYLHPSTWVVVAVPSHGLDYSRYPVPDLGTHFGRR